MLLLGIRKLNYKKKIMIDDKIIKGNETDIVMEFVSVHKNRYIFKHVNGDFSVACEIPSDINVDAKECLWFLINKSDNLEYLTK